MQGLAGLAALVAAGYGFGMAGLLGALTGLVAVVAVGSGLAIARAEPGAGVAAAGLMRIKQRSGGVLAAIGATIGAVYGGWRSGWAWAVGGYVGGVLAMLLFARLHTLDVDKIGNVTVSRLPDRFDLSNAGHIRLIDEVRERYSALLMREDGEFGGCLFKPVSMLPYAQADIHRALEALLSFAEGRSESPYIPLQLKTEAAANAIRSCLACLDFFIDVPPTDLPKGKTANGLFGEYFLDELRKGATPTEATSRAAVTANMVLSLARKTSK